MFGVTDPWTLATLLLFSIAVTLLADWMATGFRRPLVFGGPSVAGIVRLIAKLLWILLIFVAGVIAARYIERISFAVAGWLLFGSLALLLSLARARLYLRIQDGQVEACVRGIVHNLVYLLSATVFNLLLCLVSDQPANPILFVPLLLGALLPDLDSPSSLLGRLLPFVSQKLEIRFGTSGKWHSLAANLFVALITASLVFLIGWQAWALLSLGFLVHLSIDLLRPQGLLLFWPVSEARVHVFGNLAPGSAAEQVLCAGLAIAAVVLLVTVDIGRPAPPQVPERSYEQTLERYYSVRGRYLAFAWVQGSWQATGRRISGRFEILNATGESYVMLDRYDGTVFTAGRAPTDNLYIDRISLSEGAPVRIKPAEVHLDELHLRDALPIIYQMQSEPGLQHIYVSGDVVVAESGEAVSPTLQTDFGQTRLRKVQTHGDGHFTLHYWPASDLVELANLYVETADLVITATYETPAAGPTVTPLPLPPSLPEVEQ